MMRLILAATLMALSLDARAQLTDAWKPRADGLCYVADQPAKASAAPTVSDQNEH